jgi:fructosamine-3-kinase
MRLRTEKGERFFLKVNRSTPPDMFQREAEGLAALRVLDGPRVPEPYLLGPDFLLLEDLNPGRRGKNYWVNMGRQLAALHEHTNERFGFDSDNYIGSTRQTNNWTADGYAFFGEQRLVFQAELAAGRGLLNGEEVGRVASLAKCLPELVPEQPASLIHGDLWGGNAITGPEGEPAIIDPAAHYGWAEAELGMTALFGGFSGEFYAAYNETRPLALGWRERFSLYNLYHVLNHLNLFGRGYHGQAMRIVAQYS